MANSDWDRKVKANPAASLGDLTDEAIERLIDETSATERIAEHTGDRTFVIVDEIADMLAQQGTYSGLALRSSDRLLIANILRKHGV